MKETRYFAIYDDGELHPLGGFPGCLDAELAAPGALLVIDEYQAKEWLKTLERQLR